MDFERNCAFITCNRFEIKSYVGHGSFGGLYIAYDNQKSRDVAIKVEEEKDELSQLYNESRIYGQINGVVGFPYVHDFLKFPSYNILSMEILGPNLANVFHRCNHIFSLKTVLMIADQAISRLQFLHGKGYIHRDIKPENLLIGTGGKRSVIYLIDFGLSAKFRDLQTHEHIRFREKVTMVGTARYCSLNAHFGRELSRRDDLEGLAYVLIYFAKGTLPWANINISDKNAKKEKIGQIKMMTSVDEVCEGLIPVFGQFLREVRALKFDEEPNYAKYRDMFRNEFIDNQYVFDYDYDWSTLPDIETKHHKVIVPTHSRVNSYHTTQLNQPRVIQPKSSMINIHQHQKVPTRCVTRADLSKPVQRIVNKSASLYSKRKRRGLSLDPI